jgi:hypothetical protein
MLAHIFAMRYNACTCSEQIFGTNPYPFVSLTLAFIFNNLQLALLPKSRCKHVACRRFGDSCANDVRAPPIAKRCGHHRNENHRGGHRPGYQQLLRGVIDLVTTAQRNSEPAWSYEFQFMAISLKSNGLLER